MELGEEQLRGLVALAGQFAKRRGDLVLGLVADHLVAEELHQRVGGLEPHEGRETIAPAEKGALDSPRFPLPRELLLQRREEHESMMTPNKRWAPTSEGQGLSHGRRRCGARGQAWRSVPQPERTAGKRLASCSRRSAAGRSALKARPLDRISGLTYTPSGERWGSAPRLAPWRGEDAADVAEGPNRDRCLAASAPAWRAAGHAPLATHACLGEALSRVAHHG